MDLHVTPLHQLVHCLRLSTPFHPDPNGSVPGLCSLYRKVTPYRSQPLDETGNHPHLRQPPLSDILMCHSI